MDDKIIIKGAKENNLKNINLTIPRNKFIVFTGLSGSGKSSLAFDTIYAEGQRRYVESLSAYARQFLGQMEKPSVDYIEGLSPAISIDQKSTSHNPRSTVGTVTEIYDYLRLLYSKIGIPHCPICGKKIEQLTVQEIVEIVSKYEEKTKIRIISPVVRGKKGTHKKLLESIKKDGYIRVRVDGVDYDINDDIKLAKTKTHDIDIIVDRLVIKENIQRRLFDSIELAVNLADGLVIIDKVNEKEEVFSTKFSCPEHGITIPEKSPRVFSFNNPYGACSECNGIGIKMTIDLDLVIPDHSLSLAEGAIDAWTTSYSSKKEGYYYKILEAFAKSEGVSMDIPYEDLPEDFKEKLLYGSDKIIEFTFDSRFSGRKTTKVKFEGVVNNLNRRFMTSSSSVMKRKIETYMTEMDCPVCHGKRLKDEILSVTVGDKSIIDITDLSITEALEFFENLKLSKKEKIIAEEIIKEIKNRITFLVNVGLDYLTLSRKAQTLSGGEAQRIRLATQIGSALVGVLYVLDEPSIGLHQRDNNKLLDSLRQLTDRGNTLIVVEHDEDTIRQADYIVDIGPKAGIEGGEVVAAGTLNDIINVKESITGQYLSGVKKIEVPKERRKTDKGFIKIEKAAENNLKNIDVEIPLGVFTCVTGVSGSGKSTLIIDILYNALSKKLYKSKQKPGKYDKISGVEKIDKVINIDQSPIGRTPRSNPATYTGVFDSIREVFALTNEAKARGYTKSRFSFNLKGGRCEACKGDGILKIEMHFLSDVYVSCEVCNGKRYNSDTLEIKYRDKSISDVLNMDVETAHKFFENIPKIKEKLDSLMDVGLSYMKLGQPSTILSGGEAQRIKLATELSRKSTGNTLYILDEPTTGLHTDDVKKLINVLQKLTDQGNTVIVIEHNLDVIKTADFIIDLGLEGGDNGGKVIATGTPEQICKNKNSYTAEFLKKYLK